MVPVEGQVDAVTFGEWDIPAVAIAGMHIGDKLLNTLYGHRRVDEYKQNQHMAICPHNRPHELHRYSDSMVNKMP
jgi:hypothetical protein